MLLRLFFLLLMLVPAGLRGQSEDRVIARYRQLLERRPEPGTALDRLWSHFEALGQTAELIADYRERAAGDLSASLVLGLLLQKDGQMTEARTAFRSATLLAPDDGRPWQALAALAQADRDFESAATSWTEVARRTPEAPAQAHLAAGQAWAQAGDPAKAIAAWEKAAALSPDNPDLQRRLAEAYARAGATQEAVAQYEKLAKAGSPEERVTALSELAHLHLREGDGKKSIAALRRALALTTPGNWLRTELLAEFIRLHQRQGQVDQLEKEWLAEVAAHPRDRARYLQLLALYRETGAAEKELVWRRKLVGLMPDSVPARLELAQLLDRQNQWPEAAVQYEKLLQQSPDDPDLTLALAGLEMREGKVAAAARRLRRLAEQNPEARSRVLGFFQRERLWNAAEELLRDDLDREPTPEHARTLAEFLLTHGKSAEARSAQQQMINLSPARDRPAALASVAGLLEEKGAPADAVAAWEKALAADPARADWRMHLARAQGIAGQRAKALESARQAVESAGENSSEIDESYLQLLTDMGADDPEMASVRDQFTEFLRADLAAEPLAGRERLASWLLLERKFPEAMQVAAEAVQVNPEEPAARRLALRTAIAAGRFPEALDQLAALTRLDPASAAEYQRQTADLLLQAGRTDEGLTAYADLLAQSPGDFSLISARARAMQSAERWLEALETWQRAWAVASLPEKRSLLPVMLPIMERLNRTDAALALQLEMLDAESDAPSRESLLRDLLKSAGNTGKTDQILAEIRRRLTDRPEDAFLQVALALALRTQGEGEAALELLTEASYSLTQSAPVLENIVSLADELGQFETAARTQRRLIWLRDAPVLDDQRRLAELQERALDLPGARQTWEAIVERFASDEDALRSAVDFFERWEYRERALTTLQALRPLDPADAENLLHLATAAEAAGHPEEALAAAETLLQTTAAQADAGWRLPDGRKLDATVARPLFERVGSISGQGWVPAPPAPRPAQTSESEDRRLAAIRLIARTRASQGAAGRLPAWLRTWDGTDASPAEAVWAASQAGDADRALQRLSRALQKKPGDLAAHQMFLVTALKLGQRAAARQWLERTRGQRPEFRQIFQTAWAQFLGEASAGEIRSAVAVLFPEEERSRSLIWSAASPLAAQGYFAMAAELGGRLISLDGEGEAQIAAEVGAWHAHAGEPAKAREAWRRGAAGEGDTFEDLRYENLRRYLLTLPVAERRAFAARVGGEGSAIHRAIVRILAAGLCRDEAAGRRAIADLLAQRPLTADFENPPGWRYWRFVLGAGVQMQMWGMNRLALHLWDVALADEAALALQDVMVVPVISELQLRREAARLPELTPGGIDFVMGLFYARSAANERNVFASLLEWSGHARSTRAAASALLRREPAGVNFLRALLKGSAPEDWPAVTEVARDTLRKLPPEQSVMTGTLLLDYLEGAKAWDAALEVLDLLRPIAEQPALLLERRARVLMEQEAWPAAAETYAALVKRTSDLGPVLLGYAQALEKAGRVDDAIAMLIQARREGDSAEVETRLAQLYLGQDDLARARSSARQLMGGEPVAGLIPLAQAFAGKGERSFARALLFHATPVPPETRAALQAAALEMADPAAQGELRQQGEKRLRTLASEQPAGWAAYYDYQQRTLAPADFQALLRKDWAAGIRAAGEPLAKTIADPKELPADFAAKAPAGQLVLAYHRLKDLGNRAEAVAIGRVAVTRPGVADEVRFEWMDDLRLLGRDDEVRRQIEIMKVETALNAALIAPLARQMAQSGQRGEALAALELATEWDVSGSDPATLRAYADLLEEDGRDSLARVYRRRAGDVADEAPAPE